MSKYDFLYFGTFLLYHLPYFQAILYNSKHFYLVIINLGMFLFSFLYAKIRDNIIIKLLRKCLKN